MSEEKSGAHEEREPADEGEDGVEVEKKDIEAAFRDGTGIDRALRTAVVFALREHKKLSNAIAVGQHGKVVWIPPEQIPVEAEPLRPKSS
jgi:hypothetical protein